LARQFYWPQRPWCFPSSHKGGRRDHRRVLVFLWDLADRQALRLMVLDFAAQVDLEARARGSGREDRDGPAAHRLKALVPSARSAGI
jgi:hypothetical protein